MGKRRDGTLVETEGGKGLGLQEELNGAGVCIRARGREYSAGRLSRGEWPGPREGGQVAHYSRCAHLRPSN